MADSNPYPEDLFRTRGVELPSHLSTKNGRWKTLLIVSISSVLASGPVLSFPTLEPILISEGVFAGPNQEFKLTMLYSVAVSFTLIGQVLAGIGYDTVGPRILSAGSAFVTMACLVGMAAGIQFRSLNSLLWICYPATVCFGYMVNMGSYAWLYLLPDSQNTVSGIVGAIQCLADSLVLIAVFLHNQYGLSLPFFFLLCAVLSIMSGIVCLTLIPNQALNREIILAATSTNHDVDLEGNSYGAADSCVEKEPETFWDVVSRSSALFRDSLVCFSCVCPGSFLLFAVAYMCSLEMFAIAQVENMYPYYLDMLGLSTATTLVNIFGALYGVSGAILVIFLGRFVDYVGFRESLALMNFVIILDIVLFSLPIFIAQVVAQLLISVLVNATYVLCPIWILSYAPPELYGNGFAMMYLVEAVALWVGTPVGLIVAPFIDKLVSHHPPPTMKYLTISVVWCFLLLISCLAYLLFTRYYPIPAPGATTMAEIRSFTRYGEEHAEAEHFARKTSNNHEVPAANKQSVQASSTPACSPCDCLRPPLGSRSS